MQTQSDVSTETSRRKPSRATAIFFVRVVLDLEKVSSETHRMSSHWQHVHISSALYGIPGCKGQTA